MTTHTIARNFYVLEDRATRLFSRLKTLVINQLRLDGTIEALHHRVVPAVAFAAHAARHAVIFQQLLVVTASVLAAAIAVVQQAGRRALVSFRERTGTGVSERQQPFTSFQARRDLPERVLPKPRALSLNGRIVLVKRVGYPRGHSVRPTFESRPIACPRDLQVPSRRRRSSARRSRRVVLHISSFKTMASATGPFMVLSAAGGVRPDVYVGLYYTSLRSRRWL